MFGELGAVVETDGFAHLLREFAELASDCLSGEDGLPIGWVASHAEACLSFVEDEQRLAISREEHAVGLPVAWGEASFDLVGSFGDWPALFDEAGWAAAWSSASASFEFVAGQHAVPVIFLVGAVIDETID